MRLYLDACCYNRPFDDQSQPRVRLESEAVLAILAQAQTANCHLLTSVVLDQEIARTPDAARRAHVQRLLALAHERLPRLTSREVHRAQALQRAGNFRSLDALHLAAAETLAADVLLTTDDRLLSAARRVGAAGGQIITVDNPLRWLTAFLTRGQAPSDHGHASAP